MPEEEADWSEEDSQFFAERFYSSFWTNAVSSILTDMTDMETFRQRMLKVTSTVLEGMDGRAKQILPKSLTICGRGRARS